MAISILTPLQMIAGASLLQNQGISASPELTSAINAYLATPLIQAYEDAVSAGAPIFNLSGNTVPAFTNSVPSSFSGYSTTVTATYTGGSLTTLEVSSTAGIGQNMTITGTGFTSGQTVISIDSSTELTISAEPDTTPSGTLTFSAAYSDQAMTFLISTQASQDFAGGDVSKFIQALNLALAYSETTNIFINSAVNSQTYLANTFTSTNDMITGDVTTINLATPAFGSDLAKLGNLIDLSDLGDLGSPLALIQRIAEVSGNVSTLGVFLLLEGVPEEIVLNLTSPTLSVTDSIQKLMYQALTKITDNPLSEILKVLGVTTLNITTAADLLNPVKLFPNSYQSLTVTTASGPRAIYLSDTGAVNSKLESELPPYVVSTVA